MSEIEQEDGRREGKRRFGDEKTKNPSPTFLSFPLPVNPTSALA
jgi:hypothetical protein